jgi:quercetin dioxygenase-like cupin family protein
MAASANKVAAGAGLAGLLLGQVGRVLVGGGETGMAYAVLSACGPAGRPIPLHTHDVEHEIFLCTRGRMQLWAGEESRILYPGDFGSVPPGVLHAYQFHDPDTEFMGPLSQGGWERFFQFTGTPYAGPGFPPVDNSPPPFATFAAAEAEFISGARGAAMPEHHHEASSESIFVLRGKLRVTVAGQEFELIGGDTLNIPAGARHSYRMDAAITEFVAMVGGVGSERLFAVAGKPWEYAIFPGEPPTPSDAAAIRATGAAIDTFA